MSCLDFYLHQAGMWQQSTPLLMLEPCQRKPAKSECLEKIQSQNIILKMSRYQMNIIHHTKNQEYLKLNEKRRHTDVNPIMMKMLRYLKRVFSNHHKNISSYIYA